MMETAALLGGFLLLALSARLMYRGYAALLRRVSRWDPKPAALMLTGFSLATLFLLFIMAYAAVIIDMRLTVGSMLLGGLMILLFDNVLIYLGYRFSRQLDQRELTRQLALQRRESELSYYKALEEQYDRQRVLIHDIRKHLAAVRDLADEGDHGAVAEYIRQLEASPALQNRVRLCGNHTLDVVLARYAEICRRKDIRFTVDVRSKSVDALAPADLTAIFGNLLENAVAAATGSNDPRIDLTVDLSPGGAVSVSLVNTCISPPAPDGKGGFLSGKTGPGHGAGLRSVRMAVDRYGGAMRQYYREDTGRFHTVIVLET